MSEESKKFSDSDVFSEVCEQSVYAMHILDASRRALLDSKIAKDFGGKPPRHVMMYAMSKAITEVDMSGLDHKKFMRGLISICIFLLEDEDVSLALDIKKELGGKDA